MNKSWILTALMICTNAMATSNPSNLPDGKYSMECQTITVEKYDPPVPGTSDYSLPEGTDSNGINRRVQYLTGTHTCITSSDSTTIKEVYTLQGAHSGDAEDLIQNTIKSVGDNQFEESSTVTSKLTIKDDGDPQSYTETHTIKHTFAVQGNFEINLKSESEDIPDHPGRSESYVSKNEDGSYTIFSYLREGFHQDRKSLKSGAYSIGKFIYQINNICKYTPIK